MSGLGELLDTTRKVLEFDEERRRRALGIHFEEYIHPLVRDDGGEGDFEQALVLGFQKDVLEAFMLTFTALQRVHSLLLFPLLLFLLFLLLFVLRGQGPAQLHINLIDLVLHRVLSNYYRLITPL